MRAPSTAWQEVLEPGEDDKFQRYAAQLVEMQKRKTQKYGNGRALHRKQVAALDAKLEIAGGLPEPARHGLFAAPGTYEARVRLSNGSMERQADRTGDVRGFGIKVLGVSGPNALDGKPARAQDFALINREAFGFARVEPFMGVVMAAADGPLALVSHFVRELGLIGGLKQLGQLAAAQRAPFSGFASANFYSAAPIACGPYAARVRLKPAQAALPARRPVDHAADLEAHLSRGPLRYELALQFFVDEKVTPIEDFSAAWPEAEAPFVPVGTLTVPKQPVVDGTRGEAVEAAVFDPWNALAAHRPLGNVMRARKFAYFASEQARGAQ
jgi:catalase